MHFCLSHSLTHMSIQDSILIVEVPNMSWLLAFMNKAFFVGCYFRCKCRKRASLLWMTEMMMVMMVMNQTELLTHGGNALSTFDDFKDDISIEDDDGDDAGCMFSYLCVLLDYQLIL